MECEENIDSLKSNNLTLKVGKKLSRSKKVQARYNTLATFATPPTICCQSMLKQISIMIDFPIK